MINVARFTDLINVCSLQDGIAQLKAGNHPEAKLLLQRVLQLDGKNVDARVALGCLYANTGHLAQALKGEN